MAAGEAKSDFWWLVGVVCLLGLAWLVTGGPGRQESRVAPLLEPPAPLGQGRTISANNNSKGTKEVAGGGYGVANQSVLDGSFSPYFDQFSINVGNARYEYQPNQEYIILNYRGQEPLDITGWYLTNGKSERNYDVGGKLIHGTSDAVLIPKVAKLFVSGQAQQVTSNLIVMPKGRVIITTGNLPSSSDFPATFSFQVNSCSGYLGEPSWYRLQPSLARNCPVSRDWPGVSQLTSECYSFVDRSISSCHTPVFERKSDGYNYIDGREDRLTSTCRDFVKKNYNYNGCLANFAGQPDFLKPEWRVFLNRPWELWDKEREIITLYDRNNKIVTQTKY